MLKHEPQGEVVRVVCVHKQNAKKVKGLLKSKNQLDDRFRMASVANDEELSFLPKDNLIAIPVLDEFCESSFAETTLLVWVGTMRCPYSTKVLGNCRTGSKRPLGEGLYLSQSVLLDDASSFPPGVYRSLMERVKSLERVVCPGSKRRPFLERFGDDQTIVVPNGAFEGEAFVSILRDVQCHRQENEAANPIQPQNDESLYEDFWRRLALAHKSPRVVRRGGIDPNSKIRESGHRILWPQWKDTETDEDSHRSHSWICVTEQGVKQSFDLTKVMFSRGNISEKIRFGKELVQEGDVVLDLYAGIGYYTLPAVIHGRAAKVYACEWNENALSALRFNIQDNKVQEKVEVYDGDCRESVRRHGIVNMVDRVSLGLLPSSEGGWRVAIRALRAPTGGWLHVHGNVPANEIESWGLWLCHRLASLAVEEDRPRDWCVLCHHIERVKSFAPTVFHCVADVFVGLPTSIGTELNLAAPGINTEKAWMWRASEQAWVPASNEAVVTPSCALSPDGVLSQEWMR